MRVKAWRNGSVHNQNTTYGIRISKSDYSAVENWEEIKVGNNSIYRNNSTFSNKCPEIRNKIIKTFLANNNLLNWNKGKPYQLFLLEFEQNKFELLLFEPI